ncbi:MAG: 2Fe-2S iron-sulfur cluster-binding protein, partial [Longimicrobiales bacterium]|nr:2Fe-2S iron-sulfur cluster-binding protein [Longimicrobiales bacterium]
MRIEVGFQPIGKRVEIESGTTILEAAQEAGVGLSAICGGAGSCDSCRVRLVDQEQVSKPNETEADA